MNPRLVARYRDLSITSIAFPQLGCGNGELDWESQVRPLMERKLAALPIDVYVHIYRDDSIVPEHRDATAMKQWLRSAPTFLAFGEFWDDIKSLANGQNTEWSVVYKLEYDDEVLELSDGKESVIPREDMMAVWQQLRSFGYLSQNGLPDDHRAISQELIGLLSRLPYVDTTSFWTLDRSFGETVHHVFEEAEHGVRLVSQQADIEASQIEIEQMGLFAGALS